MIGNRRYEWLCKRKWRWGSMKYLNRSLTLRGFLLACATLAAGCTTTVARQDAAISPGVHYVAMGSSFAAGPGVTTSADQPPTRCARSVDNYAHLLARKLELQLTDVSCSGATTAQLHNAWGNIAPQVDALTADTRLVTMTIGGNDVAYIGTLMSASCSALPVQSPGASPRKCPASRISADAWTKLDAAMRGIVSEVRRRSPLARIIFVDYLSVLPERGTCAVAPLLPGQADASRATAQQLAALTARVAADTRSEVIKASALSKDHSACGADPWVTGFAMPGGAGFAPYHPNARGMAAIADALVKRLGRGAPRQSR